MNSRLIQDFRGLDDICLHPGADAPLIISLERDQGFSLPKEHKRILLQSNGLEAYGGYIRLFGVYTTESIDSVAWNRPDYWKFAWGDRCSGYWCFAETAWGDQYAYSLESLHAGRESSVYFLSALSMTPRVIASCFAEFFEKEFIRSAKKPYDVMMIQARQKLGPIDVTSHVVYVPSILLTGVEHIDHVRVMNARSAMICNGDVALQLDARSPNEEVKAVQTYEDELRRMRLRLLWQ